VIQLPVMTLPGRAVGAAGALIVGLKEFAPPGVRLGAFSVGAGVLDCEAEGLGASVDFDGFSLLGEQPERAAAPTTAMPPSSNPIRRVWLVVMVVFSFSGRLLSGANQTTGLLFHFRTSARNRRFEPDSSM